MTKPPDLLRQHPATYDSQESERASRREALIAAGRLRPAKVRLRHLEPPVDAPHDVSISEALSEQRSAS